MRRARLAILVSVCVAVLFIGVSLTVTTFAEQKTITNNVQFRVVSAADYRPLAGARVIVVGPDGRLLKSGLTNAEGTWSTPISVVRDPRFQDIGVVTAIGVANGYNENVVFEVPVKQGTVQPITLFPIKPKLRNEASATLGQWHHLDVIDVVNRYAKEVGLTKQPAIEGELGYAPWGPALKPSR